MPMRIVLQVVDRPSADDDVRMFTAPQREGAFIQGHGDVNSVCGSCGHVLLRGIRGLHYIPGVLFVCPACGACNSTRPAPVSTSLPLQRGPLV
jgi:predicted RNA-binding Zn-ribbon protein involved in translation (DUF1610 family)